VNQDRKQIFVHRLDIFVNELWQTLRDNKRAAVFVSNKSDIESIRAVLSKLMGPQPTELLNVKVISADGGIPDMENIGHFCDRERCKLLIFSMKVSVGTSIDGTGFDRMFALISSDHVNALAMRQAMERVRTFKYAIVCILTGASKNDKKILLSDVGDSVVKMAEKVYRNSNKARDVLKFDVYDIPTRDALSFSGLMKNAMRSIGEDRGLWATLYTAFSAQIVYRGRSYVVAQEEPLPFWTELLQEIWDKKLVESYTKSIWEDKFMDCLYTGFSMDKSNMIGMPAEVIGGNTVLFTSMVWYDYGCLCATFQSLPEFGQWEEGVEMLRKLGLDVLHDEPAPAKIEGETLQQYRERYPGRYPEALRWDHKLFYKNELAQFGLVEKSMYQVYKQLPSTVPSLYESLLIIRFFHAMETMPLDDLPIIARDEKMLLVPRLQTWTDWLALSMKLKLLVAKNNWPLMDKEEEEISPFHVLAGYPDKDKPAADIFRSIFQFSIKDKAKHRTLFALYKRFRFKHILPEWAACLRVDDNILEEIDSVIASNEDIRELCRTETPTDTPRVKNLKRKYEASLSVEEDEHSGGVDAREGFGGRPVQDHFDSDSESSTSSGPMHFS